MRGNVDLSTGSDVFTNYRGGRVETKGSFIAASFKNDGVLAPGGSGVVQRTSIIGNVVQSKTGGYAVDLIKTGGGAIEADRIDISGNATLAGTIVVLPSGDLGKSGSIVIASVTDGDLTQSFGHITRSGGYRYKLSATYGATDYLTLNWLLGASVVDTLNDGVGVTPAQRQMATHLDQLLDDGAGSSDFEDMVDDIADMTPAQAQRRSTR